MNIRLFFHIIREKNIKGLETRLREARLQQIRDCLDDELAEKIDSHKATADDTANEGLPGY